jgi:hypothetical protein
MSFPCIIILKKDKKMLYIVHDVYIYQYKKVDHDITHVVWYHPFRDLQNE